MAKRTPTRDSIAEAKRNWLQHGSPAAAEGLGSVAALLRCAALITEATEELLKPFGISFARYELLTLLMFSKTGALPMTKISIRLHTPPASVTHSVTQLEKAGLLTRNPDPTDGRGTLVSITDQGIALVASATPVLNKFFEDFGLSSAENAQLFALLNTIRAANGDLVEAPQKRREELR